MLITQLPLPPSFPLHATNTQLCIKHKFWGWRKVSFHKKSIDFCNKKTAIKVSRWFCLPQSEWLSSRILTTATTTEKRKQASNVGKNVRERESLYTAGRSLTGVAIIGASMDVPQESEARAMVWFADSTPALVPKGFLVSNTQRPALLITHRSQDVEKPRGRSVNNWI